MHLITSLVKKEGGAGMIEKKLIAAFCFWLGKKLKFRRERKKHLEFIDACIAAYARANEQTARESVLRAVTGIPKA